MTYPMASTYTGYGDYPSEVQPASQGTTAATKTATPETESKARTFLGNVFGQILKNLTRVERNAWKDAIDVLVPDYWYCKWVQDLLFGIVDFVFDIKEAAAYNRGVALGDQVYDTYFADIEKKAKEVMDKLSIVDKTLDTKIIDLDNRMKILEGKKGWLEPFLSIGK